MPLTITNIDIAAALAADAALNAAWEAFLLGATMTWLGGAR